MEEIKLVSSISQKEMQENFVGFNFFDGLMEALTEVLADSNSYDTFQQAALKND